MLREGTRPEAGGQRDGTGLKDAHAMAEPEERMTFAARSPWPGLAALMQGDAFRFRFALRPGRPGWLGGSDGDGSVLERRRALLEERWAMPWTPAADAAWERVETRLEPELRVVGQGLRTPHERARAIAAAWAPDFVLLRSLGDGMRMVGGAVCFPSGWDPLEKLCGTVGFIHGPVPGLNDDLGARIDRFLGGLREQDVLERDNWGLAATGRLDLHPDADFPRIRGEEGADGLWFRLEEQAFVGLGDGMALFLIHVRTWRLDEFMAGTGCDDAPWRMVASMSADVAAYKGVGPLRERLLREGLTPT